MTPADVLDTLQAAGVSVRLDGDDLRLRPRARITPEIRAAVAAVKPALLAQLREVSARALAFHANGQPWVLVPNLPYRRGACYSCGDPLTDVLFGRCLLCSEALWRLLMDEPIARWPGRPQ